MDYNLDNIGITEADIAYLESDYGCAWLGAYHELTALLSKCSFELSEAEAASRAREAEEYRIRNQPAPLNLDFSWGIADLFGKVFKYLIIATVVVLGGIVLFLFWKVFESIGDALSALINRWSQVRDAKAFAKAEVLKARGSVQAQVEMIHGRQSLGKRYESGELVVMPAIGGNNGYDS